MTSDNQDEASDDSLLDTDFSDVDIEGANSLSSSKEQNHEETRKESQQDDSQSAYEDSEEEHQHAEKRTDNNENKEKIISPQEFVNETISTKADEEKGPWKNVGPKDGESDARPTSQQNNEKQSTRNENHNSDGDSIDATVDNSVDFKEQTSPIENNQKGTGNQQNDQDIEESAENELQQNPSTDEQTVTINSVNTSQYNYPRIFVRSPLRLATVIIFAVVQRTFSVTRNLFNLSTTFTAFIGKYTFMVAAYLSTTVAIIYTLIALPRFILGVDRSMIIEQAMLVYLVMFISLFGYEFFARLSDRI